MTGVSVEPTKPAGSGFWTRVGSAALLVPILLALVWFGPDPWAIAMGLLAFIGSEELGKLLSRDNGAAFWRWGPPVVGPLKANVLVVT